MIKAVIFDIDGTLVDSVHLHALAWRDAFAHFGIEVSVDQMENEIGKGGDQIIETYLTEKQRHLFGTQLTKWRGEHFKATYIDKVKPFPESHDLLERVRASGKKIAAGSSAHKEELDHYLDLLDAKKLFDVATTADDASRTKPHPDIFDVALERLDLLPANTIVVGDSPYDAEAATKAGMATIGFLSGRFEKSQLLEVGVIEIYSRPGQLLQKYDYSAIMMGVRVIASAPDAALRR